MLHVLILLFWALAAGEETTSDLTWGNNCPTTCTCHMGHLGDLPINQWLERDDEEVKTFKPPTSVTNEVFYEDDANKTEAALGNKRGSLLKIAMCIFQIGSDPQKVLNILPSDIQALTLLQSRGSEDITLEADHMKKFQQLMYFDIQGYSPEVWKAESSNHILDHNFMLSNDVMKPLVSLQYLSLQRVKLLGSSLQSNEIDHEGQSAPQLDPHQNEISLNYQTDTEDRMRKRFRTPNLVILKSSGTEQELVPYQVYKEQQERARLSIFARLSNLVLLRVIDCGLHEVYWEMFEGLRKLEHLSLEKNQLHFLPEFAFYGAPNLKTLSLSHNKLLNIHSTGLAGLLELQKLDLSYNNFSHLSEFSLPPFPKLNEAYLWHNPIEAVFGNTFEIMNATRVLYLGSNNSSFTLHPKSFQGLIQLKKLVLYNVGIEVLERELLSGMPQLKYLKLSGSITSISFDAFIDAPLLETLDLQYCNIKSLSMDSFYGLYRLIVLDLSNNLLESLPPGLFDQQTSLRELYLQNNSLTELPDGFFTSVSAKMVRLEGNLWHCTCNMKGWLPSATNRIKEVKSERRICENDKGVGCPQVVQGVLYIYEKKVAPRCNTPSEYKGWSVYHVLRKELRCSKPVVRKFNRREYIKRKYNEYEKSNTHDTNQSVPRSAQPNGIDHTLLESINNASSFNKLENNTSLNNSQSQSQSQLQAVQQNHESVSLPKLHSTHSTFTSLDSTKKMYLTPITNNSHSLIENTEQETIENIVPLIPTPQKQNNLQHFKLRVQPKFDKTLPIQQHNIGVAAETKKKIVMEPVGHSRILKTQPRQENYDTKFLKKLWKTELQRKHQEKMKNQMS